MSETNGAGGLARALAAFQAEAPTFSKSKTARVKLKTGGEYTYKYADLGDILPVVGPLLAKHGLSWSSKPARSPDGELLLRYRLLHVSGEADGEEMPLGVERTCKPQELGSAITYARRYALTAQLNLATDEDDDGATASATARPAAKRAEPVVVQPTSPQEPLVTAEDIAELRVAAKGLKASQIRMAFSACGIPVGEQINLAAVPKEKTAGLAAVLASTKRES